MASLINFKSIKVRDEMKQHVPSDIYKHLTNNKNNDVIYFYYGNNFKKRNFKDDNIFVIKTADKNIKTNGKKIYCLNHLLVLLSIKKTIVVFAEMKILLNEPIIIIDVPQHIPYK